MSDTLIIAGDSQSAARSPVTLAQTYGNLLACRMDLGYTNCSVGGDTSTALLARWSSVLSNAGSQIGIMIGANDAYLDPYATYPALPWSSPQASAVSVSTFVSNLTTMIADARTAGKTPFYITPWAFWSTPSLNNFPFYVSSAKTLMASLSVPVVDAFQIQFDLANDVTQSVMWDAVEVDYQHPNAIGHFLIYLYAKQVLGVA